MPVRVKLLGLHDAGLNWVFPNPPPSLFRFFLFFVGFCCSYSATSAGHVLAYDRRTLRSGSTSLLAAAVPPVWATVNLHSGGITAITAIPAADHHRHLLVTAGRDGTVHFLDASNGAKVKVERERSEMRIAKCGIPKKKKETMFSFSFFPHRRSVMSIANARFSTLVAAEDCTLPVSHRCRRLKTRQQVRHSFDFHLRFVCMCCIALCVVLYICNRPVPCCDRRRGWHSPSDHQRQLNSERRK